MGSVLEQEQEEDRQVVKRWLHMRLKHSMWVRSDIANKKLLAVVTAIEPFKYYLTGWHFTVVTDHASLTWLSNLTDLTLHQGVVHTLASIRRRFYWPNMQKGVETWCQRHMPFVADAKRPSVDMASCSNPYTGPSMRGSPWTFWGPLRGPRMAMNTLPWWRITSLSGRRVVLSVAKRPLW